MVKKTYVKGALSSLEKGKWLPVMNSEVDTLQQMNCWEEVERPVKLRVLGTKLILK